MSHSKTSAYMDTGSGGGAFRQQEQRVKRRRKYGRSHLDDQRISKRAAKESDVGTQSSC